MKYWLISYDISDSKKLRKVSKILEKYGVRVQYSFFEVYCSDSEIEKIKKDIESIVGNNENIIFQSFCIKDWKKVKKYGINVSTVTQSKEYIVL